MSEIHDFVAADECLVCSLPEADPIHEVGALHPSSRWITDGLVIESAEPFATEQMERAKAWYRAVGESVGEIDGVAYTVHPATDVEVAEESQPAVRSTTARRIHNRARNLAARWVREHHPDVWTALADRAADELGVPRSKVHGER